jgi:hypothetical protein
MEPLWSEASSIRPHYDQVLTTSKLSLEYKMQYTSQLPVPRRDRTDTAGSEGYETSDAQTASRRVEKKVKGSEAGYHRQV